MISSVLNLANAFLELLNTPFGQAATRITLVTTALTGLYHILQSYMGFMKGGAIFGAVSGVVSTIKGLIETQSLIKEAQAAAALKNHAAESALTFLQADADKAIISLKALAANFAITAGFAAAFALAIKAGTAKFDAYNGAVENTAAAQSKLGEYKDELADLESRTDTLTEAERHRLDVLREITAEQEKQVQAAKQAEYETYSEAYGSGAGVATGTSGTGSGGIGGWGRVESVQRDVYQLTEYQRQLNDLQEQYANQTKENAMSTGEYYAALQNLNDGYADTIEKLRDFIEAGIEVTDSERALVMAYDEAQIALGNVGTSIQIVTDAYTQLTNSGEISKATWETLIAYYPQLADGAVQTANGYQIQESALLNLMSAEQRQTAQITTLVNGFIEEARQSGATEQALLNLVQAQITASNTGLNFTQQIAALQALAQQAGYTASYVQAVLGASTGLSQSNIERTAKGLMYEAQQKGKKLSYQDAFAEATKRAQGALQYQWNRLTSSAPSGGYTPAFSGGSKVSVPSTKPSGSGTSGKPSSSTYDDSKRSEAQAQIKQLQAQQDVVQDKIDAVNEKYDAQLKELEDINDALEEQIQLQKLLQALTEAKASKKMVFKDGRFQYLSDVDAIAKAQSNLEDFYQEQELKKRKKRIEEERQAELAGLEEEKKNLQDRISAWRDYLSSMGTWSGSGYFKDSYDNLSGYVSAWNSKIDQIKNPPSDYNPSGGSGNTDKPGGNTDKPGSGGQTSTSYDRAAREAYNKYPAGEKYDGTTNDKREKSTAKLVQEWYGSPATGTWTYTNYTKAGKRNYITARNLWSWNSTKYKTYDVLRKAAGYKTGTLSAQSGLSMVGEQGPELRVLNQGDGIIPAKQTATLWSFANDPTKFLQNLNNIGGKTDIFNIANVSLPNVQNSQEFISGLRNLAYQRTYKPNFGTV